MSDIYRLAKPKKKGLIHLVFSRFFVILMLLAVQLAFVIIFYDWLKTRLPVFEVLLGILTIGAVVYLFNSGMDPAAKLTWMFVIAILPVTGAAMLAFTQMNLGHGAVKRREAELIDETKDAIPQSRDVLEKLKGDSSGTDDLVTYLNQSNCFPVYDNTEVTFFPLGED